MNGSEMLTCSLALALALAFRFRAFFGLRALACGRARRVGQLNARTLLQPVIAIHHDTLAGLEPVLDDIFSLLDLGRQFGRQLYGASLDRLVVLDNPDEGPPFRSALDD